MRNSGKLKLPIISLIIGFLFWSIGELLFNSLTNDIYTPLGIAIYILFFAIILSGFCYIYGLFQVDMNKSENARDSKDALRAIIILLIFIFATTFGFEFLYELGDNTIPTPTSYVFLIDDSGSMATNDPNNMRATAIDEIMKKSTDMPYAVYKFDENANLTKSMSTYESSDSFDFKSEGGTDILTSVKTVLSDYTNGNLIGSGEYPRIILLSDGSSSTSGIRNVTKDCTKNGISICSVGFGGCNEYFLTMLANRTGGSYTYCNDVSSLAEDMEKVVEETYERNLLSDRYVLKHNILYGFLRILFLAIIGIEWAFLKFFSIHNFSNCSTDLILKFAVLCFAGTLIVELLSQFILISVVRLLFCLLWAFIFGVILYSGKTGHIKANQIDCSPGPMINNPQYERRNRSGKEQQKEKSIGFAGDSKENGGLNSNKTGKAFNTYEFGKKDSSAFGRKNNSAFTGKSNSAFNSKNTKP